MRLRSMTILFFSSLLLSTSVVAEELDLELYFDGVKPSEALALSGVYATEENSCIDIIIDGSEGRVQEADRNLSKGTYNLPIDDLCLLTLLNMDQTRNMVVRFADSMRNIALLSDQEWTTSGAQVSASGRRSFTMILSRRAKQSIQFQAQYEGSIDVATPLVLNLNALE